LLIVQTDLQLTPNSLLPSEQFVIGGGPSVRGYRQNARTGDNGIRFSVEDRITLSRNSGGSPIFQLAPFLDLGAVWNTGNNPNNDSRPDQRFLIGGGLGILWELAPGLNLRFDYGIPFIDLDDRGNNFQDDGLYFSVTFEP
jgi:hemolysin activation/secretion protein